MIASNLHGRTPRPDARRKTTTGQAGAARKWATANLPAYSLSELQAAASLLATHPDAASPGYSQARRALERVRAEVAGRPT